MTNAAVAVAVLSVLAAARWLDPDPAGHATHTQLGLPPCTFYSVTGAPCPMCGATTSWALAADGRVTDALWTQPFGVVLFVLAVFVAGVSGAEAIAPRGRWRRIETTARPVEPWIALGLLLAMIGGWAWKIAVWKGS